MDRFHTVAGGTGAYHIQRPCREIQQDPRRARLGVLMYSKHPEQRPTHISYLYIFVERISL